VTQVLLPEDIPDIPDIPCMMGGVVRIQRLVRKVWSDVCQEVNRGRGYVKK